jgi:ABC-type dipeptide/oligopeptide/nickel transport system permease component
MAVRFLARTAQMLFVVLGAATLTFFLLRLAAGDPARLVNPPGTPEQVVTQVRERLGTDEPLLVQYKNYLVDLAHGDLGTSFHGEQSVREAVLAALPNTAALAGVTIVIASILGLTLGIVAALYANRPADRLVLVYVALAQSTPNFWLAVVLVLIFSIELQWLPAIDKAGPESFVLPVTTLVVMLTPVLIRTVRQSFLETLGEDHVRAARARGLRERRVLLVHGLKVVAPPFVTLLGLQVGFVLAGAYVVEFIFNWPGIGKLTLDAINSRNFPMIQGCVLVAAFAFVLVNFVVDLVYGALDPRIRHGRTG